MESMYSLGRSIEVEHGYMSDGRSVELSFGTHVSGGRVHSGRNVPLVQVQCIVIWVSICVEEEDDSNIEPPQSNPGHDPRWRDQ